MTQFEIDTHIFIDEIQRRPALWNPRSDLYMNKIIRKKTWEDMVLIFGNPDDTIENKQILELKLRRKWKSLRDNYVRQKKKMNSENLKSGAEKKRKTSVYVHFKRLHTFLQSSPETNAIEGNPSIVNKTLTKPAINSTSKTPNITENINAMQIQIDPAIEYIANVIGKSLAENKKVATDEDKLFCLSLFNEIKKVPDTRRLKLKIEIYDLILKNQIQVPQPRQYEYEHNLIPSNLNFTAPPLPLGKYFPTLYNQQCMTYSSEYPSTSYDTQSYTSEASSLEEMTITQSNGIQQEISNTSSP